MWRMGRSLVEEEEEEEEGEGRKEREVKKLKVKYTQVAHDKVSLCNTLPLLRHQSGYKLNNEDSLWTT